MLLPKDQRGKVIQLTPNTTSKAVTVDSTISSATSVALNQDTTLIEVTALNYGVYMKYAAGVSASSFDEFIAPGMTRHFLRPEGVSTISFIEKDASATIIVIEK